MKRAKAARPEIRDPELDADIEGIAEMMDGEATVPVGGYVCTSVDHDATWSGLHAYVHRIARGLSRAEVRDGLLDLGVDATTNFVRRLEHAAETGVDLLHARALASVLDVEVGAFLNCGSCYSAALDRLLTPEQRESARKLLAEVGDPTKDLAERCHRFAAVRIARGFTIRALARAAKVRARDVVRFERGAWHLLGCNDGMALMRALGVDEDGEPLADSGGTPPDDDGGGQTTETEQRVTRAVARAA